jgi:hypothetical protein
MLCCANSFSSQTVRESFEKKKEEQMTTVDPEVNTFRHEVVRAFLACGVPLNKLNKGSLLRKVLERSGGALGESTTLSDHIPLALDEEVHRVKEEMQGCKSFAIIFDGTSRVADCHAFIVRFVLNGQITQRLVNFQLLKKPPSGPDLFALLCNVISREFDFRLDQCLAYIHDRAATNTNAVALIISAASTALDIGTDIDFCFVLFCSIVFFFSSVVFHLECLYRMLCAHHRQQRR